MAFKALYTGAALTGAAALVASRKVRTGNAASRRLLGGSRGTRYDSSRRNFVQPPCPLHAEIPPTRRFFVMHGALFC
jgi:hypothetical protein